MCAYLPSWPFPFFITLYSFLVLSSLRRKCLLPTVIFPITVTEREDENNRRSNSLLIPSYLWFHILNGWYTLPWSSYDPRHGLLSSLCMDAPDDECYDRDHSRPPNVFFDINNNNHPAKKPPRSIDHAPSLHTTQVNASLVTVYRTAPLRHAPQRPNAKVTLHKPRLWKRNYYCLRLVDVAHHTVFTLMMTEPYFLCHNLSGEDPRLKGLRK